MPQLQTKLPVFKPAKDVNFDWDNFRRGLNTLLKETEVQKDELVQADNLMLIGKGVPTKRWGTDLYFLSAATGSVRGLKGLYQADGTTQLLCITDQGILTQKSNASFSTLTGASWASGYNAEMTQLDDKMYIVNGNREMVRYSNPTLYSFATLAIPTGAFATQVSGVSGTNSYAYRISSVSDVGETTASTSIEAGDCPDDLGHGSVLVTWSAISTASGVLKGYNIYGRRLGDERFLKGVNASSTSWYDDGSVTPSEFTFPATADSTGGIIAKYIMRFEDRLIFAGIDGEPSKVVFGGKVANQEKFDWSLGGGFTRIEPDAGDNITGLSRFENKIIVFKEKSIWQITFSTTEGVTIGTPQLITGSHGAIAPRSIVAVENDIFFLSRKGVYALGYEPNIFNVIRTNEISAKIRPFFDGLTTAQKKDATAFYYKFQYGLAFPGKDKTMVYDRERLAWMGPWNKDARVFDIYYDSSDDENLIYGEDNAPNVMEYDEAFGDDDGTTIATTLRTRKDDFKDWARFKNIKEIFTLFRNVQGTVNVDIRLQQRDGQVTTAKSFSITTAVSSAGWASGMWADQLWADSEEAGGASDINEIYRWTVLNKPARNVQFIVSTNNRNDNYELLAIKANAKPLGLGFIPSSEKV
jgi:hypothetical protein